LISPDMYIYVFWKYVLKQPVSTSTILIFQKRNFLHLDKNS